MKWDRTAEPNFLLGLSRIEMEYFGNAYLSLDIVLTFGVIVISIQTNIIFVIPM